MNTIFLILTAVVLAFSGAFAQTPATLTYTLDANATTGCAWTAFILAGDSVTLDSESGVYTPDEKSDGLVGVGGTTVYTFTAVRPGDTLIRFRYGQPWSAEAYEERIILVTVDENMKLTMRNAADGRMEGTVVRVDEAERTALLQTAAQGEVIATFGEADALPCEGENIIIYTNGTMTMSIPGIVNVLAWETVPGENARVD